MNECCEDGFETRTDPETNTPYALACKQHKPHLRFIQLNTKNIELELQDAIQKRIHRIKNGDTSAT